MKKLSLFLLSFIICNFIQAQIIGDRFGVTDIHLPQNDLIVTISAKSEGAYRFALGGDINVLHKSPVINGFVSRIFTESEQLKKFNIEIDSLKLLATPLILQLEGKVSSATDVISLISNSDVASGGTFSLRLGWSFSKGLNVKKTLNSIRSIMEERITTLNSIEQIRQSGNEIEIQNADKFIYESNNSMLKDLVTLKNYINEKHQVHRVFLNFRASGKTFNIINSPIDTVSLLSRKKESLVDIYLTYNLVPEDGYFDCFSFSLGSSGYSNFDNLNEIKIQRKSVLVKSSNNEVIELDDKPISVYRGTYQEVVFSPLVRFELLKIFKITKFLIPATAYYRLAQKKSALGVHTSLVYKNSAFGLYAEMSDIDKLNNSLNVGVRTAFNLTYFNRFIPK